MSAVDKCSLPNRDNLMQPIHLQSKVNFQHFQKKDDAHSLFISEGTACEKRGSIYV